MLIDRSLEYQIVNSFGIDSCEKLQDAYNSKEYGDNGEQLINLQNWASGGDHYLKLGTLKSNKK